MGYRSIVCTVALLAGSFASACDDEDKKGSHSPDTCTVTLSGAISENLDCVAPVQGCVQDYDAFGVGFDAVSLNTVLGVGLYFAGKQAPGTYTEADADVPTTMALTGASQKTWLISTVDPPTGTFTLNLTSVGTPTTQRSGDGCPYPFPAHGTLQATLNPADETGATGDVMLNATF